MDCGEAVIVARLDQSAAFDMIDHRISLHRFSARFGICDLALDWSRAIITIADNGS